MGGTEGEIYYGCTSEQQVNVRPLTIRCSIARWAYFFKAFPLSQDEVEVSAMFARLLVEF